MTWPTLKLSYLKRCFYSPYQSPHVRDSKNVYDSEFRYWIPDSLAVRLEFHIPILSRIRIPWAVIRIPKPRILIPQEKFAGFRIARRAKISQIPDHPNALTGRLPTILHILNWSNQLYIHLIANCCHTKQQKKKQQQQQQKQKKSNKNKNKT